MIKLINQNPFDISVEAFRRYHKLSIEAKNSLELTHPLDLTKEALTYYNSLAPVLNFEVKSDVSKLRTFKEVEDELWGIAPQVESVVELVENEDKQDNIDDDSGEKDDETTDPDKGEGNTESDQTPDSQSDEGTPDPEQTPEEDTPSEETPTEGDSLKDKIAGMELPELKELAKSAGLELKGRVTRASATKALLENEEAVLNVL
ncbi:hypothetical protein SP15_035 [Bacillus phage SP-15]|uniref:Uncharacterized protein n=1 Tax=Bacillus phage SP-15 TaxID=1792032 RepID=A0A127AX41_9CAUD|nr:hypothetical protein SP15_035 [Bacillus phage SP-15]AMM44834.1 hypothetical protein SP15_035 [Bacillus phage SP-15]